MDQAEKDKLLAEAQEHVKAVTEKIIGEIPRVEVMERQARRELTAARRLDDRMLQQNLVEFYDKKLAGLEEAADAAYFARCDVVHPDGQAKTLYFGKCSTPEFGIYSWVSPAAQIRFSKPGEFSYRSEGGQTVDGRLERNDQYLIGKGKVAFMAVTTREHPRMLIYQEYFSNRKSTFALPEIVERMEQAQDAVIRANHEGSFLISGPAGSGKTTLALHRIAYLLQSPEVSRHFEPRDILVLVQDDSTKQYFDGLLPSLGIRNVAITTFASWAKEILGLEKFGFVSRYGGSEAARDRYETAKHMALAKPPASTPTPAKTFTWLEQLYSESFDPELEKLFAKQHKEKVLDRFDLTALLTARAMHESGLSRTEKVYDEFVIGKARFTWQKKPIRYSLILLDEVQNYLPAQIRLIKACISEKTRAMTYVGDLAQQTSLFTLRDWATIDEDFSNGRIVKLEKVYRSTRQILEHIRSMGYAVEVPEGAREGKPVKTVLPAEAEIIIKQNPDVLVGVLGIAPEELAPYQHLSSRNVRVMPIIKAQGVEFDIVFLVLNPIDLSGCPEAIVAEKKKVLQDQIYVGLTRAMNELYILDGAEDPSSANASSKTHTARKENRSR